MAMVSVLESLNHGLRDAMTRDDRVFLLGEDILSPYGGAFKVARGLSESFPDRVLTTPISEAAIVGLASGMALRGLRPVVEIMFGDFTTLIADQLINHAAKFRWMYNDQVRVPVVIRTPMGGRRGYGPTHSQTLEKLYLGVPGLRILAPGVYGDPGELLVQAILADDDPVLFVENKLLYLLPVQEEASLAEFTLQLVLPPTQETQTHGAGQMLTRPLSTPSYAPAYRLTLRGAPAPQLTIAAYGYMAELGRQAILRLAYEQEIFAELVVVTQLAPFEIEPILESSRHSRRLLVIEEGTLTLGWGAEILARASESLGPALQKVQRLAALDLPVPASGPLELQVLPGVDEIFRTVRQMFSQESNQSHARTH
jgi:pyruvate/2-oxoglutarate/acetoin dehydrogenase E1 component